MRITRLKQSADFQRLLGSPIRQRSAHFAIHHVASVPLRPPPVDLPTDDNNLSTRHAKTCPALVDDSSPELLGGLHLGCLVPKRHARRAVTRNLMKRQMRAAAQRLVERLPPGMALLRLKQPFATGQFPSARSDALRDAVRQELDGLLHRFATKAATA